MNRIIAVSLFLVVATLAGGLYQNCSSGLSSINAKDSSSPSVQVISPDAAPDAPMSGNGHGYGGFVFVFPNPNGPCADGSRIAGKIVVGSSQLAVLVREQCANLAQPKVVEVTQSADKTTLTYNSQNFVYQPPVAGATCSVNAGKTCSYEAAKTTYVDGCESGKSCVGYVGRWNLDAYPNTPENIGTCSNASAPISQVCQDANRDYVAYTGKWCLAITNSTTEDFGSGVTLRSTTSQVTTRVHPTTGCMGLPSTTTMTINGNISCDGSCL